MTGSTVLSCSFFSRNVLALMYHLGNTAEVHLKEVESNINRVKEYQEYLESMMDRLLDMVRGK